jgi:hypothetical protein
MQEDFDLMLDLMDRTFRDLENAMPTRPVRVQLPFGKAFRFQEKDIHQALIQKLARVQSAVRAAYILLKNGFLQEQAILHRVIDETNEDILFLVFALIKNTVTDLHRRYLDAFWEEEIDESGNMINSKQKRPMIPRKKIRAYLASVNDVFVDQNTSIELSRTISKTYSGFVHGASPHIMDMYGGEPPHFHITGMLGTPRLQEHADDLWNYMYRTFLSHILVAKAFGEERHVATLIQYKRKFERNARNHF